jgi:hypothetical protein
MTTGFTAERTLPDRAPRRQVGLVERFRSSNGRVETGTAIDGELGSRLRCGSCQGLEVLAGVAVDPVDVEARVLRAAVCVEFDLGHNGALFSEPRPGLPACASPSTAASAETAPLSRRRDWHWHIAASSLCLPPRQCCRAQGEIPCIVPTNAEQKNGEHRHQLQMCRRTLGARRTTPLVLLGEPTPAARAFRWRLPCRQPNSAPSASNTKTQPCGRTGVRVMVQNAPMVFARLSPRRPVASGIDWRPWAGRPSIMPAKLLTL